MNTIHNINLNLFGTLNTTATMTEEMKTFYEKALIQMAEPNLIHEQFGQKVNIPANNGKKIEFRKWSSLPEATTPLTEGVTPAGQSLEVTTVEATVKQFGDFVSMSDMLEMTAIDPIQVNASKAIASQAGRTLDTVVRDIINAGTTVQYGGDAVARSGLTYTSAEDNDNLTVDTIRKAVRYLEAQDAPKINGYYVAIIHPNVKYDLMSDPKWRNPHEYMDTKDLYRGEIGELYGVRFVESSRAKIFPKAGAASADVYSTLVIADGAYGVTEINGGGLEYIVKQLGEGEDRLNQRSSVGWKATMTAEILVPQYLVRVETTATPVSK